MNIEIFEIIEKNFNLFIPGAIFGTFFGAFLKFLFDRMNQKAYFRNEYYKRLTEEMMQALKAVDKYLNIVSNHKVSLTDNRKLFGVIVNENQFQKYLFIREQVTYYTSFLTTDLMDEFTILDNIIIEKTHSSVTDYNIYSKNNEDEILNQIQKIYKEKNLLLYESKNIRNFLKKEINFKYKYDKYKGWIRFFLNIKLWFKDFFKKMIYNDINKNDNENN